MNTRVTLLLLVTLALAAGMHAWLGRAPVPKPPVVTKAQPVASPVISPPKAEPVVADGVKEPRHYRPPSVTAEVRRKVDDFIRRYNDAPPEELYKTREMISMKECFERAFNDPAFQREMTKRIDTIGAAKGQQVDMINLASGKLENPENRAWLEALFADDSDMLQEYLLNKLDGAIFDFAFDPSQEQSSNGVTVKNAPAPAPAANKQPD